MNDFYTRISTAQLNLVPDESGGRNIWYAHDLLYLRVENVILSQNNSCYMIK